MAQTAARAGVRRRFAPHQLRHRHSSGWRLTAWRRSSSSGRRSLPLIGAAEAASDTLGWLVSAAYGYHALRRANVQRVRIMGGLLTVLGTLMVLQTLFWLVALRRMHPMAPRPVPPEQIKTPSIKIGIQEGRGGSTPPAPRPNGN